MKPLAQNTLIQNRYLIVHLIGKGGMGEVYLAVDQRLGSAVALKRTFFAGDEMLGNAFEREARTLARMRHPVLPKVSDHFGENDEQYLVMEHISGDDLSKRLEAAGKPFPLSWVLFWADQLLDALSYLHTHEPPIIHRDIKPQNLKLTDENHIILLDFGLSKTSTGQTNISQSGSTGSVVGYTPHYAPMEQIRGIGTSARSDLYSLSATLYQLLTNSVPVDALSRADSMLNGMPDPITPPHELNPEVPKVVSDVLLRAMEVSQEKRFANAREMQRVLRKAYSEIQQATTANTVAFSAEEARGIIAGSQQSEAGSAPHQTGNAGQASVPVNRDTEAPAIEPDSSIDLDATMAYDPTPAHSSDSDVKQSAVRTEVFLSGVNSLPLPDSQIDRPPVEAAAKDSASWPDGSSQTPPPSNDSRTFTPEATVPFVALDQNEMRDSAASPSELAMPSEPDFFEETRAVEGEPAGERNEGRRADVPLAVSTASAAYGAGAAAAATQPARKSSGKTIAVAGGLAALLLLGLAVAGGVWAYMVYGPGQTKVEPTPQPTTEPTAFATPSPEPTLDAGINADTNTNSDTANVNSNVNNELVVPPTPAPTAPEVSNEPVGTRPTPRVGSTPRTGSTPSTRPTAQPRKTPVPRATVMP